MAKVAASRSFTPALAAAFDRAKIIGVRAGRGATHRFTGVWVVVVEGRVFARSWGVTSRGWFDTFRRESAGTVQVGQRRVRVQARPVRSERILDAVEQGYAAKYPTPASRKWVRGFRAPRRRAATVEFIPASGGS
jgi:hypothetical protein